MNNSSTDPINGQDSLLKEQRSLLQRLRKNLFPVKPADIAPVRMLKQSAFYLFVVMVAIITVAIILAISFVL